MAIRIVVVDGGEYRVNYQLDDYSVIIIELINLINPINSINNPNT